MRCRWIALSRGVSETLTATPLPLFGGKFLNLNFLMSPLQKCASRLRPGVNEVSLDSSQPGGLRNTDGDPLTPFWREIFKFEFFDVTSPKMCFATTSRGE